MKKESIAFSQYCISVGLLCILLFTYGFFPIKLSTNKFSSEDDFPLNLQEIKFHKEKLYSGNVSKTILMVIDGIRVDFVTAENMPYTAAVVDEETDGCQLTARVSAPTVTLPRIKSIVTGAVSSFMDVVLNFGTQELMLDNIVHQAVRRGKKLVFYGDNTWLDLFPQQFMRSEGTTSFYVTDYTEVDNNVTRHLDRELQQSDWSVMVLHYLGLDHIGHVQGPNSPLIQPKLREMDAIITRLNNYLKIQGGGVLVVCGDHGMKDTGSHGGVSLPEVLVPVVVFGLACPGHYKEEILQVDLAPTLSALWGAPIPVDSVGVAALGLLSHMSPAQQVYTQYYNAQQLSNNFLRNGGSTKHESYVKYEEATEKHYEWLTNTGSVTHHQVSTLYADSLKGMSGYLSTVLADYHLSALITANVIALQIVCTLGLHLVTVSPCLPQLSVRSVLSLCAALLLLTLLTTHTVTLVSVGVLIVCYNTRCLFLLVSSVPESIKTLQVLQTPPWQQFLVLGVILHSVSLFSSSLIEEEHQVWYWLWATVCLLRALHSPRVWLPVLAVHRVLRTLDLSDWLTQHPALLSTCCLLSLGCVCWCCYRMSPGRLNTVLYIGTALSIYQYKAAVQQVITIVPTSSSGGTAEARICWLLLSVILLLSRSLNGLVVCWTLTVCLLLRSCNTVLVPVLFVVSGAITSSPHSTSLANTVLHHWLGYVLYFCQGNSNSLASVDVAAGYVGLVEYNVAVVTVLLLIHTYAMPVMAYLLNIQALLNNNKHWRWQLHQSVQVVMFLHTLHMFLCLVTITLQRFHLFVWTVFSPKLLYVVVQSFLYFTIISITNFCLCFSLKNKFQFFEKKTSFM